MSVDADGTSLVLIADNPARPRMWSNAASVDTGTQWADPENTNIMLEDEVQIQVMPGLEAKYIVDTRLYDKTAGQFVEFNNGFGAVNAGDVNDGKVPNPYKTPAGRLPDGFMSYFGRGEDVRNGVITTTFNTKSSVETGQTQTIKVRASIDGTQNGGLAGHTLVFINVLTILNGAEGNTPINHKGDSFLVYQTPTDRRDNNAVLEEGGKEINEIQTALEDASEMIFITRSSTNIISSQTKRKRDDQSDRGESIVYAEMYLDDSLTSGGGASQQ